MSRDTSIKVATWNLEWAAPGSRRGQVIGRLLRETDADILCLTEAHKGNFPLGYHVVMSHEDYGYPLKPNRRKVLIGSKWPWRGHDDLGQASLPGGRYIAGITQTPIGAIKMVGVCIPWADAHVRTGRRDRTRWQDHEAYLEGLTLNREYDESYPIVVAGDFNQTLPRKKQPEHLSSKLEIAFSGLNFATRGFEFDGRPTIDHIAVSPSLEAGKISPLPNKVDELNLSDHFGAVVELAKAR